MNGEIFKGLKVVELADFISGPYCGQLMANFGADLIKIEKPGVGDEARSYGPFPNDTPHLERSGLFLCLNTNKKGVTLDVTKPRGHEIFLDLIKDADVLIENSPPRLMEELKLDYNSLKEVNPNLIVSSLTAFGQTGPYKDYKAEAINVAAVGGFSLTVGSPDREPLTAPLSIGDYQSGAISALGITTALIARNKIGKGQHIDVSGLDIWAGAVTGQLVSAYVFKGMKKCRGGYRIAGSVYPSEVVPCKDGYVWLIAIQGYQWKRFLEVIGGGKVPDWYANDARFKDRREMNLKWADELDAHLLPWLKELTKEEFFTIARKNHLPFTPIRNIADVLSEPHFKERPFFIDIEHPETGTLKYPGAPFRLSKTPWKVKSYAPLLGQHNEEIFCGCLGFSKGDLDLLRDKEVI